MSIAHLLKKKKKDKVVLPKDLWRTPDYLFIGLDREFDFGLDAAASPENAKCNSFIDEVRDAFKVPWVGSNVTKRNVFINPPYSASAGGLINWTERAYEQSQKLMMTVVMVMPGDTSTKYRKFAMKYGSEIRDLDHRVKFVGATGSPPWPTALFVFSPLINCRIVGGANVTVWNYKSMEKETWKPWIKEN